MELTDINYWCQQKEINPNKIIHNDKKIINYKKYILQDHTYIPDNIVPDYKININIAVCITDIIEFIEFNNENILFKPSKLYIYNLVNRQYKENTYITNYFNILHAYGICDEELFPYIEDNINKVPNRILINQGKINNIYDYYYIEQSLDQIKKYLLDNVPILFGLKILSSQFNFDDNMILKLDDDIAPTDKGIMLIMYGYDDEKEYVLVKNTCYSLSINNTVDEKPFFWIHYSKIINSKYCSDFIIIKKHKLIKTLHLEYHNDSTKALNYKLYDLNHDLDNSSITLSCNEIALDSEIFKIKGIKLTEYKSDNYTIELN